MLHKPDNNWVSKQENKTSSIQDEFVCCGCIMMTNQEKEKCLMIKRRISVSPFTFPVFGLDRKSLDFETERYQLKSSLEF